MPIALSTIKLQFKMWDLFFFMNHYYWTSFGDILSKLWVPEEAWSVVKICILQICYPPEFVSLLDGKVSHLSGFHLDCELYI